MKASTPVFYCMAVCFASLCVRLCGGGGADRRTDPLGRGGHVRDPARVEPRQRASQAAALRLHRQRRGSPGLNTHTPKTAFVSCEPLAHMSAATAASGNVCQNGRIFASGLRRHTAGVLRHVFTCLCALAGEDGVLDLWPWSLLSLCGLGHTVDRRSPFRNCFLPLM